MAREDAVARTELLDVVQIVDLGSQGRCDVWGNIRRAQGKNPRFGASKLYR